MDPLIVFMIGGELLDDSIKLVIDSGVVGPLLGPSLQQLLELGEIPTKTPVVTLCGLIEVELCKSTAHISSAVASCFFSSLWDIIYSCSREMEVLLL